MLLTDGRDSNHCRLVFRRSNWRAKKLPQVCNAEGVMNPWRILLLVCLVLVMVGGFALYTDVQVVGQGQKPLMPIGTPIQIKAPLGMPPVPVPSDNPPTSETVALGRRLYYDPALSVDGSVACATCHSPEFGFADPKPFSEGVNRKTGTRNSPTVINAAYFELQFWDGRAPSLEKQAEVQSRIRWKWRIR
jgi:cytochrome c peroxidase